MNWLLRSGIQDEYGILSLQNVLLNIMLYIDNICKRNNIEYYVIGGTALGAARHGGFIPWDDDIDVGMPRKDYEKLKEIAKTEKGRFRFETYDSIAEDYCYAFTKLYDTTTTLVERKRVDVVRGVYIDIFPLDGIGATKEEGLSNYYRFKRLNQVFEYRVNAIRKGRSWIKNAAVLLLRIVPDFVLDQRLLRIKLNKIGAEYDFYECKYGGNFFGAYWEREIMDLSLLGTPKYYHFEDMMVAGPEDAEGYLKHIYGDWRRLPSKEKQVSHHDYISCNLNKSYLDSIP